MKSNVIIYAVGIYKGGGLQVLKEFIQSNKNFYYIFDSRLDPIHYNVVKNFKIVKQGLVNIILTQLQLKKLKKNIIFINGLPPLIKLESNTFVLYQNLNIFPPKNLLSLYMWIFSTDFLRFIFFKFGRLKVQTWFVLSEEAFQALSKNLGFYQNIVKLFFFEVYKNNKKYKKYYDFIYPADLKRHKNHDKIINALINLSKQNIKPSFLFTLTNKEMKKINFPDLKKKINIHNFDDFNNRSKFIKKMQQSKCLFFPSEQETIGLPIIEGYNNNLLVATSNRNYAKQFIEPDALFNINSNLSIQTYIKNIYQNKIKKKKNKKIKNLEFFLKKRDFFQILND